MGGAFEGEGKGSRSEVGVINILVESSSAVFKIMLKKLLPYFFFFFLDFTLGRDSSFSSSFLKSLI